MIVVYVNSAPFGTAESDRVIIARKRLEKDERIPPGAIWIDLTDPTVEEDRDAKSGTLPT